MFAFYFKVEFFMYFFKSIKKTVQRLLTLRKPVNINEADLVYGAARGSGPGGQAVAKTNNMAIIQHKPTGIVVKVLYIPVTSNFLKLYCRTMKRDRWNRTKS